MNGFELIYDGIEFCVFLRKTKSSLTLHYIAADACINAYGGCIRLGFTKRRLTSLTRTYLRQYVHFAFTSISDAWLYQKDRVIDIDRRMCRASEHKAKTGF